MGIGGWEEKLCEGVSWRDGARTLSTKVKIKSTEVINKSAPVEMQLAELTS